MKPKRNILLIDDSEKFAFQVQLVLLTNGSTGSVEIATTLSVAHEVLALQNTHIIISDIMLGDENALDMLREVKQKHPGISVIVLTNFYDDWHRRRAMAGGADHFVDKAMAFSEIPKALAAIEQEQMNKVA